MDRHIRHAPVTYILPTTSWAVLLDAILRDAPPGSTLKVATEAMFELSTRTLAATGRHDMYVVLSAELAQSLAADRAA